MVLPLSIAGRKPDEAWIAQLWPARRAARLDVLRALAYE